MAVDLYKRVNEFKSIYWTVDRSLQFAQWLPEVSRVIMLPNPILSNSVSRQVAETSTPVQFSSF